MKIQNLNKVGILNSQYEETLNIMEVLSSQNLGIVLVSFPNSPVVQFSLNNDEQKEITEQMVDLMRYHYAKKLKSIREQIEEL